MKFTLFPLQVHPRLPPFLSRKGVPKCCSQAYHMPLQCTQRQRDHPKALARVEDALIYSHGDTLW